MGEALPVLIVEGDQHMREMLQRFLIQLGIEARTAIDIAEAQALQARYTFSVVLTELFWPHNDGLSLLRYIRATAPDTRVVMMSSFISHEVQQCVLAAGAYATIGKPFPLQRLAALLQQILPGG